MDTGIMERFLWRRIYPDEVTIVLAEGGDGEGPVLAHVIPLGDDPRAGIEVELCSNLPEYVTLRMVYDHFRAQDMTLAEWRKNIRNELAAMRLKGLVAKLGHLAAEYSGTSPPRPTAKKPRIVVEPAAQTIEVDDVVFAGIDYHDCLIVKVLVEARGNWMSRVDMQEKEPHLQVQDRIDRRINKHIKLGPKLIGDLIEGSRRGYRIKPCMFE